MIKIFYKNIKDSKLTKLDEFRVGSWICVENPTEKECEDLVEMYEVDSDLLLDALDINEVPRIEIENNLLYVYMRYPDLTGEEMSTSAILLVIGGKFIMTVCRKGGVLNGLTEERSPVCTTQKIKMLIQFFLWVDAEYAKLIRKLGREIREKGLNLKMKSMSNKDIVVLASYENVLNDFLSSLVPMNSSFQKLISGKYVHFYDSDKDLVEDLLLDTEQLVEMCKSNLKLAMNFRETHTMIMTNELNKVMKVLTSITAILTIPTIVSGIFGMNVNLPLQGHPFAFLIVVGGTVMICIFLLLVFLKNKLL